MSPVPRVYRPLAALVIGAALLVPVQSSSAFAAPPSSSAGPTSPGADDGREGRAAQTAPAAEVTRLQIFPSTRTVYKPNGDSTVRFDFKATDANGDPVAGVTVTLFRAAYRSDGFPKQSYGPSVMPTDVDGNTAFTISSEYAADWAGSTPGADGTRVQSDVYSIACVVEATAMLDHYGAQISYGRDSATITNYLPGIHGAVQLRSFEGDDQSVSELVATATIASDGYLTFTVPLEHGQSRQMFFSIKDRATMDPGNFVQGDGAPFVVSPRPVEGAQAFKRTPTLTLKTSGSDLPGQPVHAQATLSLDEDYNAPEIPADGVPVHLSYTVDGQPRDTVAVTDRSGHANFTMASRMSIKMTADVQSFRLGMWSSDGATAKDEATITRQTRLTATATVADGLGRVNARLTWADDAKPLETRQTLELWKKSGSKWSLATKATTNAAGEATFTPAPKEHTTYQVRYAGSYSSKLSGDADPSKSKDMKVRAVAQVTLSAPATAKKGAKVKVSGTVTPTDRGRSVNIKANGNKLTKVKTDSRGRFSGKVKLKRDTTLSASVSTTKTLDGSTSNTVTIHVT